MAPRALRFVILTAARTGKVRSMLWREIDFDTKMWTVPGDRMKEGKTHRLPLSPAALAVLEIVQQLAKTENDLVFPGGKAN